MPPVDRGDNPWSEYRRLVLSELQDLSEQIKELKKSVDAANVNIAMLKVKASMWGALGGLMTALAAVLMAKIMK